jgi:hypothetical protein
MVITTFLLLSGVFYSMSVYAPQYKFRALEAGNSILATLLITTYLMVKRQVKNNSQAFIRGVYSASFLKLMVCMISILVYVLLNRSDLHKPTVFLLFGIYALYTLIETLLLSKSVKSNDV